MLLHKTKRNSILFVFFYVFNATQKKMMWHEIERLQWKHIKVTDISAFFGISVKVSWPRKSWTKSSTINHHSLKLKSTLKLQCLNIFMHRNFKKFIGSYLNVISHTKDSFHADSEPTEYNFSFFKILIYRIPSMKHNVFCL